MTLIKYIKKLTLPVFLLLILTVQLSYAGKVPFAGVNFSGGEYGSNIPGNYGGDYFYSPEADYQYFKSKGMNIIRMQFLWERAQHSQLAELNAEEMVRIKQQVEYALSKDMVIILDSHNSMKYYGELVGSANVPTSAFVDFWTKMADFFKYDNRIWFDLSNEPDGIDASDLAAIYNDTITGIRSTGAHNMILLEGTACSGAHSWNGKFYGTPNGTAMLNIVDPDNNFAFQVHQYLDPGYSGTHEDIVSETIGVETLTDFTNWCKDNGYKGFLGETACPRSNTGDLNDPNYIGYKAVENMFGYMQDNNDVWLGWTWWAAGIGWGEYMFTLQPDANGNDRPQMSVVQPYFPDPFIVTSFTAPVKAALGEAASFDIETSGGYGDITYSWDFDDGTNPVTDKAPVHTYTKTGTYNVTVKVQESGTGVILTKNALVHVASDVNSPPVSNPDSYYAVSDASLGVNAKDGVLANDTDADMNSLTAVLHTAPTHGTVTLNADGSFSYAPESGFTGLDSFSYKSNDGAADGNVTFVKITVNLANLLLRWNFDETSGSVANDISWYRNNGRLDNFTFDGNSTTGKLGNALNFEGNQSVSGSDKDYFSPSENDISVAFWINIPDSLPTGVYYPVSKATNGYWEWALRIDIDASGATPKLFTWTTAGVDNGHVFSDTTLSYNTWHHIVFSIRHGGDGVMYIDGIQHGTSFINSNMSNARAPFVVGNRNGGDFFIGKIDNVQVYNRFLSTKDINTIINDDLDNYNCSPFAVEDSYSTNMDTPLQVPAGGILQNDGDPDGDSLTAIKVSDPSNGTLTLNSDGSFSYTPASGFAGNDSFKYKVSDGNSDSEAVSVNITVASDFHSISGTVSGDVKQGVTVSIDATHSATTDGSGNYTISGLADGAYTVTPTLAGYTFAPATASATVSGADVTGVDFVSTQNAAPKFTLTVNNGTGSGQYEENDSANISATVPADQVFDAWSGDTQYLADASAASTTVTMPAQDVIVTATFKQAPPNTHSISGTVSGDVQQGVAVAVDSTHSATTDASGNYTIGGLADGTYTVTPTLAGYTFAPATASATVSGADVSGVDFVSTQNAAPKFTLTVNNGTGSGQYEENDSANISATVPAGQIFDAWTGDTQYIDDTSAASTTVTMPAQDVTVTATFKQAPPDTHSISGTVSGDVQAGVSIAVDATHSATTDASGNYTIGGLTDGTYTVTPTLPGYTFAPATASATVSGADVTGVDFSATQNGGGGDIPTSIAGCVLWLDGADPAGDGSSVTGAIGDWKDKSGTGNDAVQNDTAKQPTVASAVLNGKSVLTFDGTDDNLNFTQITDIKTIFWVLKEQNQTSDGSSLHFLLGDDGKYDFHRGTGTLWDSTYVADGIKSGATRVDRADFDGLTTDIPADRYVIVSLVTSGDLTASQITKDRNFGRTWDGGIAEIIIYNQTLSDTDRDSVENYLYNKWFGTAPSTYSISGTVTGDIQQGVTVAVDATHSVTTDASGNYTISGLADGTYTVTPTLTDYTFAPATASATVSGADVTGIDFVSTQNVAPQFTLTVNNGTGGGQYAEKDSVTISATVPAGQIFDTWTGDTQYLDDASAASTTVTMPAQDITVTATFKAAPPNTFSISGTVTGDIQQGVTVAVDATHSATTDASGNYTISGLADGTYTVTPTITGYTFTPATASATVSGADVTGVDFTSTQNAAPKFTLTVNNGTGSGEYAQGETVNISATVPSGQVFDAWTGDIQYLDDASAVSTTLTMPAQDITVTAVYHDPSTSVYSISGTVTGDIQSGITIKVDTTHSAVTHDDGSFTILGLIAGSYTVTPTLSGYLFSPASRQVVITGANVNDIDFTAQKNVSSDNYSISGKVTDDEGNGLENAVLSLDSGITVNSNVDGEYTFSNIKSGTYIVTATLADFIFSPQKRDVIVSDSDVMDVNFSGKKEGTSSGNNAPIALSDKYYTKGILKVEAVSGVLCNDIDPDGDSLTAIIVTPPLHGTILLGSEGGFSYSSDSINALNDSFTYSANDGVLSSQPVKVEIFIEQSGELPVTAVGDSYKVPTDSILTVPAESGVLINDLNVGTETVSVYKPPENGKLELNDDGSFEYKPNVGFDGIDSFTYVINSATPGKTASVSLLILAQKVTIGSVLAITDSMVKGLNGSSFAKPPKIYGMLANGKKASFKKVKTSTPVKFFGIWSKKVSLYDKKTLKASGYKTYFDSNGALAPMNVTVMVKGKTVDKTKIDEKVMRVQLVPPVITAVLDSAGNSVIEVSSGSTITVKGKYFGFKIPKVYLEVNGKLVKCKVDSSAMKFTDSVKNKPSPMDAITGDSQITLTLPSNIQKGVYPLILDNKIGIATTPYIDDSNKGSLPMIIIK